MKASAAPSCLFSIIAACETWRILVPQETLTFNDGSTQTINTPTAINGGGAFMGFTDFGNSIVSVSYNATNDIVALDDVLFKSTSVPEPASLAILAGALFEFGVIRRRRRM